MSIVFTKRVTPKRRNEAECTEASISTIEAEGPREVERNSVPFLFLFGSLQLAALVLHQAGWLGEQVKTIEYRFYEASNAEKKKFVLSVPKCEF